MAFVLGLKRNTRRRHEHSRSADRAGHFHAASAQPSAEYVYRILNRAQRSALLRDSVYFIPQLLDHESMAQAAEYLLGRHDFAAFRSTNADEIEHEL